MALTEPQVEEGAEEAPRSKPAETLTFPAQGGRIEIAIWENTQKTDNGDRTVYSVTIQRTYRDGEEWKRSKTLFPGDLLPCAEGLRQAFALIANSQTKK